jgi:hypothetical protein
MEFGLSSYCFFVRELSTNLLVPHSAKFNVQMSAKGRFALGWESRMLHFRFCVLISALDVVASPPRGLFELQRR